MDAVGWLHMVNNFFSAHVVLAVAGWVVCLQAYIVDFFERQVRCARAVENC